MSHLTDLFPNIPDVDKHQQAAQSISIPQSAIDAGIAFSKDLAKIDDVICPVRASDGLRSSDIETMLATSSPILQRIIYGGLTPNGPSTAVDSNGNPLNAGKSDSDIASTAIPSQQILADLYSATSAANDSVATAAASAAAKAAVSDTVSPTSSDSSKS